MNDLDKILANQALIMRALAAMPNTFELSMRDELHRRARISEQYARRNEPVHPLLDA